MANRPAKLVRLKPLNPRKRYVMKLYVHGPSGKTFYEKRGWYKVDDALAEYLSEVRQIESDEDSPLAFDVCTQPEAKRIDERERKVKDKRAQSGDANDLTTGDLRRRADRPQDAPGDRHAARRGAEPASRQRSMRVSDATDEGPPYESPATRRASRAGASA
jgi:hypothetical protein